MGMLGLNAYLRKQWQEVLQAYQGIRGPGALLWSCFSSHLLAPSTSSMSKDSPRSLGRPAGRKLRPDFQIYPLVGFQTWVFYRLLLVLGGGEALRSPQRQQTKRQ